MANGVWLQTNQQKASFPVSASGMIAGNRSAFKPPQVTGINFPMDRVGTTPKGPSIAPVNPVTFPAETTDSTSTLEPQPFTLQPTLPGGDVTGLPTQEEIRQQLDVIDNSILSIRERRQRIEQPQTVGSGPVQGPTPSGRTLDNPVTRSAGWDFGIPSTQNTRPAPVTFNNTGWTPENRPGWDSARRNSEPSQQTINYYNRQLNKDLADPRDRVSANRVNRLNLRFPANG